MKVELKSGDINIARLDSITPFTLFHHHLNCVYGSNFCNSKFQTTCCFGTCCFGSLQRRAPPRHTSDHRVPHVPLDEIDLEAQNRSEVKVETPEKIVLQVQNQSEVKVEPKPGRYNRSAVGFYNYHFLLVSSPSQLCFMDQIFAILIVK